MKPRDTSAEVRSMPPHAHAATRQTPHGVSQALFRAETACYPPVHTPQCQPKTDYALPRQVPPV
jgi:hypothetical protein